MEHEFKFIQGEKVENQSEWDIMGIEMDVQFKS